LAQALVQAFRSPIGSKSHIDEIALVPAGGGCYEISVDGRPVYSKLQSGRHITDADAIELIRKAIA
jgi:selT/selW/selH-like putative selenoprotein